MSYSHLKAVPTKKRPKMLVPPYSSKYFSGGYLALFLVLLSIVILNGVYGGIVLQTWWSVLTTIIGCAGMLGFHMAVSSGWVSSNMGTYSRETEPVRFWVSTLLILFVVIIPAVALWLLD